MYPLVAIVASLVVFDVLAGLLAPRLARRLGNGMAFLITWFMTGVISFAIGVGAVAALDAAMEGEARLHVLIRAGFMGSAALCIVVPPLWLLARSDRLFVKGGGWHLTARQRRILGLLAVGAGLIIVYDLFAHGELLPGENLLIEYLLLLTAIVLALYAWAAPPAPAPTTPAPTDQPSGEA